MTKYHISPSTGNPNICRASEGNCPFGADEPHYSSKEEARVDFEKREEARIAEERAARKQAQDEKNEREWPSPSEAEVERFRAMGYHVDVRSKSLVARKETPGGFTVDSRVSMGEVSVQMSDGHGYNSYMYVRAASPFGADGKQYTPGNRPNLVEFSDFGTSYDKETGLADAREHLGRLETAAAEAPQVLADTNKMIEDAEELFGRPVVEKDWSFYDKVQVPAPLPLAPGKAEDITETVRDVDGVTEYHMAKSADWRSRDSVRVDSYIFLKDMGYRNGINSSSMSSATWEELHERIGLFRNAIATVEELQARQAR